MLHIVVVEFMQAHRHQSRLKLLVNSFMSTHRGNCIPGPYVSNEPSQPTLPLLGKTWNVEEVVRVECQP
jgi:hypothetical protein